MAVRGTCTPTNVIQPLIRPLAQSIARPASDSRPIRVKMTGLLPASGVPRAATASLSSCDIIEDAGPAPLDLLNSTSFAGMLEFDGPRLLSLGGHRGLGMNPTTHPHPAKFRENTISSFAAAIQAGASFIEFDVQVTRDGVPVLFHDNYVVWGHEGAPTSFMVRDLSVHEFKGMSPCNSTADMASLTGNSEDDEVSMAWLGGGASSYGGSPSGGCTPAGMSPEGGSPRLGGRLLRQHRHDVPAAPFEPSLRPWSAEQEDELPTLAEVFGRVAAHVAFDIEIKTTTPDDVAYTPHEEVDRVVSATLQVVDTAEAAAAAAGVARRDVMFSSFDPEVCVEVKRRRPHYPVMFLSGAGKYAHVDQRRTSAEAAIAFASANGMQGIILESNRLRDGRAAVTAACAAGLRVLTYGEGNNEAQWVHEQALLGVAGCIVDDVAGVATALSNPYLN